MNISYFPLPKIFWLLLIALFTITSVNTEKTEIKVSTFTKESRLVRFQFQHSGKSKVEIYSYDVEDTGDEILLTVKGSFPELQEELRIQSDLLEDLFSVVEKYRMDQWDGFDKNNPQVLDGEGFSLYLQFSDGTTVEASGENSFPDNYDDAFQEFIPLIEDEIRRQIPDFQKQ